MILSDVVTNKVEIIAKDDAVTLVCFFTHETRE
jgi:hypothetical protein